MPAGGAIPAASSDARPWAVVALNMGGPDSPEAVRPFLRKLLGDPALVTLPAWLRPLQPVFAAVVARKRAPLTRHHYGEIGGSSPLAATSLRQVTGVCDRLTQRGLPAVPFVAMRYWHPFAASVARSVCALNPAGVVLLSLYPQYSFATSGSSIDDMTRALKRVGLEACRRVVIDRYPEAAGYVHATADSVRRVLDGLGSDLAHTHVMFSAHGLPQSYVDAGDPYRHEIERTWRAVTRLLPDSVPYSLAFQSRVGPRKWLQPYSSDRVRALAAEGVRRLIMVPLAFVSDHIETLFEMDVELGAEVRALGMEFVRIPALNDDSLFLSGLADLVAERVAVPAAATAGG